jgi:hypothetical protein
MRKRRPPRADSGTGENIFPGPPARADWQGVKVMKQKQGASYKRWPLAASDVSTTNHDLVTSDTTEKDKNIRNIFRPPSETSGPDNVYRYPPTPCRWHWRKQGIPHTGYFVSKLPELWCGRRKMQPPNPRQFACYWRKKLCCRNKKIFWFYHLQSSDVLSSSGRPHWASSLSGSMSSLWIMYV